MSQITRDEIESLMVYVSSFYLLHQKRFERGFIFGNKFYVAKFNTDMSNVSVKGLEEKKRFGFIKEFGMYALSELLVQYKPDHGYFVFSVDDKLFMATVVKGRLKIKKINREDLKDEEEEE